VRLATRWAPLERGRAAARSTANPRRSRPARERRAASWILNGRRAPVHSSRREDLRGVARQAPAGVGHRVVRQATRRGRATARSSSAASAHSAAVIVTSTRLGSPSSAKVGFSR
jgi:hypothetical protein